MLTQIDEDDAAADKVFSLGSYMGYNKALIPDEPKFFKANFMASKENKYVFEGHH